MSKNSVSMVAVLLAALCSPSVPEKTRAAEATKILILFEGHRVFTTDQLRSAMLLGEPFHAIRSSITEELQQRLQRVREFLIAKGYVTARLGTPQRAKAQIAWKYSEWQSKRVPSTASERSN
jgi:hemolysin activation/secretion protein